MADESGLDAARVAESPRHHSQPGASSRLGVIEKCGYGLGDTASNFYWKTLEFYLLYFYTDVFGIQPRAIATLFLVTRLWDAINDPIVGYLADRTRTRWGRFRPYLLWMGLPLGLASLATFTTPPLNESGRLVYAYVTYGLLMMAYTAVNTPYGALLGVISADSAERTSVATYRFVAAFLGAILVQSCTLDLVDYFGGGDDEATGFFWTMALYSVFAVILFWISFATTRERVEPRRDRQSTPRDDMRFLLTSRRFHQIVIVSVLLVVALGWDRAGECWPWLLAGYLTASGASWWLSRWLGERTVSAEKRMTDGVELNESASTFQQDFHDLMNNGPWKALFVYGMLLLMGAFIRNGVILYYFKYCSDYPGRVSSFLVAGSMASIVGMLAAKPLSLRFGKRSVLMAAGWIAAILTASIYGLRSDQINWLFGLHVGGSLAMGPAAVLLWSMYADTADYSEWKTQRRATGLVFSAATFSQKLGCSVGAALAASMLGMFGYLVPVDGVNWTQSETALHGLRLMISLIPAGFLIAGSVSLYFYQIDAELLRKIENDLRRRSDQAVG